jgi:hypothetical protein
LSGPALLVPHDVVLADPESVQSFRDAIAAEALRTQMHAHIFDDRAAAVRFVQSKR